MVKYAGLAGRDAVRRRRQLKDRAATIRIRCGNARRHARRQGSDFDFQFGAGGRRLAAAKPVDVFHDNPGLPKRVPGADDKARRIGLQAQHIKGPAAADIEAAALADGECGVRGRWTREWGRGGGDRVRPRGLSTGQLVYAVEDGTIRAVPFDLRALEVAGSPVPLLEEIVVESSGAATFDGLERRATRVRSG